jgi:hypothetical protein
MLSNIEKMVELTNVMVDTVGKFVSVTTESEGRAELPIVDTAPQIKIDSPVSISLVAGADPNNNISVALDSAKQKILEEVDFKLQQIRDRNRLNR